jgi:hypothetical protein
MSVDEESLGRLARALGVGLMLRDIEAGPPVRIVATALLDGESTEIEGVGETEADAWDALGRSIIEWKGNDPRNIRTFWGGF